MENINNMMIFQIHQQIVLLLISFTDMIETASYYNLYAINEETFQASIPFGLNS